MARRAALLASPASTFAKHPNMSDSMAGPSGGPAEEGPAKVRQKEAADLENSALYELCVVGLAALVVSLPPAVHSRAVLVSDPASVRRKPT